MPFLGNRQLTPLVAGLDVKERHKGTSEAHVKVPGDHVPTAQYRTDSTESEGP